MNRSSPWGVGRAAPASPPAWARAAAAASRTALLVKVAPLTTSTSALWRWRIWLTRMGMAAPPTSGVSSGPTAVTSVMPPLSPMVTVTSTMPPKPLAEAV